MIFLAKASKEFLIQSGILGPMGSVSSILKKSSKIKPMLSDPGTKEAVSELIKSLAN